VTATTAGSSLATTTKYLCCAAGIGLSTTAKYRARCSSVAPEHPPCVHKHNLPADKVTKGFALCFGESIDLT
jgi:hypothetical protein